MTVLSNHRLHSYKASRGASHNRDITPKKCETKFFNKMNPRKRSTSPAALKKIQTSVAIASVVPAPVLSIITEEERIITVWGEEYRIQLPEGYDIYDGLRRWYPSLYEAVMEEEKIDSNPTEEEMELVWERQDYLEWLFD